MPDLSKTIIAKSDQLNSDDLIGRSITIKVTKVSLLAGEQPISIHYEGDEGKPWKPCKSMRRVLVGLWGSDGNAYIGRSLTLYRDETVIFAGAPVGGIRISHMSHIDGEKKLSLTVTRASKKPFIVRPLAVSAAPAAPEAAPGLGEIKLEDYIDDINNASTLDGLQFKYNSAYRIFAEKPDDLKKITDAKDKRKTQLTQGAAA